MKQTIRFCITIERNSFKIRTDWYSINLKVKMPENTLTETVKPAMTASI